MLQMRTSERRDLKSCTQRWWWGTVEGLRPRVAATPLWFGSAVHEALARWYIPGTERGEHPASTLEEILGRDRKTIVTNDDDEREFVSSLELGIDMLNRYVEFWGPEPEREVISTEYEFRVWLPRPEIELFGVKHPAVKRWLRYVGTFDGVFRDLNTGELWLDETKTAASIWDDHLPLDDQAGSYWAVATTVLRSEGLLKPGEEIAGISYNFLRKALGDYRPVNEQGLRMNKPTTKQHLIDALANHYGQDDVGAATEILENGSKLTMAKLQELLDVQGIEAHGDVSAQQPPPFFERFPVYRSRGERATMIRRIQEEAIFSEAYREGWLPVTKSPSQMNCRGCQFRSMCLLDEAGDQLSVAEFKEAQYDVVDPYAAHDRKSAE